MNDFNINGNQQIKGHHNVGQQGIFGSGGNQGGNGGNFNIKGNQLIGGNNDVGQQGDYGQTGYYGQGSNQGGQGGNQGKVENITETVFN